MQLFSHIDLLKLSFQEMIKRTSLFAHVDALELPFQLPLSRRLDALKLSLQTLVEGWDVFDLALSMTLVLLMFYTSSYWYVRRPITLLCIAAILHPPLRRSKTFWLIITLIVGVSNYYNWRLVDNHQYLITYWCLALYGSLLTANPGRVIALNARWLIGLAFLFATLWKVIFSNDYLGGSFFHYTLLLDQRFESTATFFGGLTNEVFLQNRQALGKLLSYSSTLQTVQLQDSPLVFWLAQSLTWWTICTEGLIAIAFLWPEGKLISKWRDWPLLLFLLTTYSVAPVLGFGCVLIAMGVAQCAPTFKYTRLFYVVALFVIQISYFISNL